MPGRTHEVCPSGTPSGRTQCENECPGALKWGTRQHASLNPQRGLNARAHKSGKDAEANASRRPGRVVYRHDAAGDDEGMQKEADGLHG